MSFALFPFLSYVFITSFTPGPNNIISMSNGTLYGVKNSIGFNVGVFCGFTGVMLLSSAFNVALYTVVPAVKLFMTVVGAAYFFWLAYHVYKSNPEEEIANKKNQ
jgi:threonine/homoserine/homoserine lactone efflux protein